MAESFSLTASEWDELVRAGVLGEEVYLRHDGQVRFGHHEFFFSPQQAAQAAGLGIRVRSYIDAILEDPAARAEMINRLGEQ